MTTCKPSAVALVVLLALPFAQSQQKSAATAIDATRKILPGTHPMSLQWISWEQLGKATITDEGGRLRLKGEQRKDPDFVTVDGAITEILPHGFRFHGKVITRISYINKGQPCVRDGDLTFLASGERKFWRMQQMTNPCDEAADYVDIYFKRP